MSVLTAAQKEEWARLKRDLEAREILKPTPDDLPKRGALVRLADGLLGEVLSWLDRNPDGEEPCSDLRVAMVELTDFIPVMDGDEHASIRIVPEDRLTVVRPEPSDEWIRRRLAVLQGPVQ